MNKEKQVHIASFGCKRRFVDAERIKNYFSANGIDMSVSPKEADYLIIVTCGLTKDVEARCISCIESFKKLKGKLLIYGCLPAMNPEALAKVYDGKTVITMEIAKFDELFPEFAVKFKDIPDANRALEIKPAARKPYPYPLRALKRLLKPVYLLLVKKPETEERQEDIGCNNNFFTLRISEGCLGSCSYCNIRKAIGRLKSKPVSLLLRELRKGLAENQYKINIISSDTGSYGMDIGSTLPELLWAILNEDKRITIEFIQDLHPHWICRYKKDFIDMAKTGRIKSMLTAFQSGNSRILKLMRRDTDLKEFKETINSMREYCPGIKIRTQAIVGFPTETEEEFMDTLNFIKECGFNQVDIFPYYELEGMESKNITPKVEPSRISVRVKKMRNAIDAPSRASPLPPTDP